MVCTWITIGWKNIKDSQRIHKRHEHILNILIYVKRNVVFKKYNNSAGLNFIVDSNNYVQDI